MYNRNKQPFLDPIHPFSERLMKNIKNLRNHFSKQSYPNKNKNKKMGLIETFLLKKFKDAIENDKSSSHSTYLPQLEEKRNDLEASIEKNKQLERKRKTLSSQQRIPPLETLPSFLYQHPSLFLGQSTFETLEEIKTEISKKENEPEDPKTKTTFRWSTRLADPTVNIPGFEDRAMVRMLVDEDDRRFGSIGIIGMAGVGKTTLCQVSFGNPKVTDRFFPRIWVSMSREKDEVARRMLTCLGFEDEYAGRLGVRAVEQQLKGKKCLVVLDKVDEVELPSLEFLTSGKVIVTSRSAKAGGIVGKKNLHELLAVVDKERCWDIFKGEAGKDGCWEKFEGEVKKCYGNEGKKDGDGTEEDERIKNDKIKGEIVESCNGLPLVAKMKGQILHGRYITK